ncbi:MAG: AMP nucleosidase, partial [Verrucomicrobiota bacterium]
MKKEEFVGDWLFRYTGCALDEFGKYILLCNFSSYVRLFSDTYGVPIRGEDRPMSCATHNDITIINFGIGSPSAATIIDLLTAISPSCVVFLGKCGSVKPKVKTGDYILPIAGIRGEGTSDSYLPPEVPALPAFALQRTISSAIKEKERDYWTGTVFTTNRRVWEHDDSFREYLKKIRAMAVDMETATIFSVCFHNEIVAGSLLLVSDQPLYSEGIKTSSSDKTVDRNYLEEHLSIGILAIQKLIGDSRTLK